jgi:hypothetical protein
MLLFPDVCNYKTNDISVDFKKQERHGKGNKGSVHREIGYLATFKNINVPRSIMCEYVHSNSDLFQAI